MVKEKRMKLKSFITIAFICLFFLPTTLKISAQESKIVSYESRVIESFDNDPKTSEDCTARWIVIGSKFVDTSLKYPIWKSIKAWPEALFGKNKEGLDLRCLGIMAGFTRKGYNSLDVIPSRAFDATKDKEGDVIAVIEGKKWVQAPIIFPGRIRTLTLWIWGSNYNYYIEVHLKDHNGAIYVLPIGDLTFTGWKHFSIDIPPSIPQAENYIPRLKRLQLELFRIWTRPDERVTEFWVYLDDLKVLTDLYETRYDGDDLEDESFLQGTWGLEKK
jgi:hypothetical protein